MWQQPKSTDGIRVGLRRLAGKNTKNASTAAKERATHEEQMKAKEALIKEATDKAEVGHNPLLISAQFAQIPCSYVTNITNL